MQRFLSLTIFAKRWKRSGRTSDRFCKNNLQPVFKEADKRAKGSAALWKLFPDVRKTDCILSPKGTRCLWN